MLSGLDGHLLNAMFRAEPSRAPSPTYTTFSDISNYRLSSSAIDSFRKGSIRHPVAAPPRRPSTGVLPVPAHDGRVIARARFAALSASLADYLARGAPRSHPSSPR
jgi:hypothetical protein